MAETLPGAETDGFLSAEQRPMTILLWKVLGSK